MVELTLGLVKVSVGIRNGTPVALRNGTFVPRAFALRIDWTHGGWFWTTPVGFDLETETATGPIAERHIIMDTTRLAIIVLGIVTAISGTSALRARLQRSIEHG